MQSFKCYNHKQHHFEILHKKNTAWIQITVEGSLTTARVLNYFFSFCADDKSKLKVNNDNPYSVEQVCPNHQKEEKETRYENTFTIISPIFVIFFTI